MIEPQSTWKDTYQPTFDDVFSKVDDGTIPEDETAMKDAIEEAWQTWVDDNANGIEVPAPYATLGSTDKSNLSPLQFPLPGTPIGVATIIAAAWALYINAISYPPPPPAAPFSVITDCIPNPGTVSAGQLTLQASLGSEFSNVPNDIDESKYENIAAAFWSNTSGPTQQVLLIGLSQTAPPVPVIMPYPVQ